MFVPLWLRRNAQDFTEHELRKAANIALFHERSNELEAELAAGNLEQAQFDALVAELQQKLLRDVRDDDSASATDSGSKKHYLKGGAAASSSKMSFAIPLVVEIGRASCRERV